MLTVKTKITCTRSYFTMYSGYMVHLKKKLAEEQHARQDFRLCCWYTTMLLLGLPDSNTSLMESHTLWTVPNQACAPWVSLFPKLQNIGWLCPCTTRVSVVGGNLQPLGNGDWTINGCSILLWGAFCMVLQCFPESIKHQLLVHHRNLNRAFFLP